MTQEISQADLPTIRLMPKANARAIRHGSPWVFDNELVTDRRTKALAAGTIARLEDAERKFLGTVAVNPNSRIFARMLERDESVVINRAWLVAKLKMALDHRTRLFDKPFYRLVHAEADGLPGVVIDRFGDVAVIQPNAAWAEAMIEDIAAALAVATDVKAIVKNGTGRSRSLEGLPEETVVLKGEITGPIPVLMNGATYMADILGGQKTGLFYDQRPNHAFVQGLVKDQKVLDVFSHVGGFALAALAGGAKSAISVDSSQPALDLAELGAKAMKAGTTFATRKGDAFDTMAALETERRKFGVVVCDPPAFAPSKPALEKGLRAYERVARMSSVLVEEGGYLVLCSCSHAADLDAFRTACIRGIGRAGRTAQLIYTGFAGADHPLMPQLAESGYLKALVFRML
ncbi:Ribosomal RNA large subunit methyltransferase I [Aquimixticola soesokkakensis]|uniref:Ribosomal RNA large subunit methyltransferase I n=1 Tax=Aquimixticola soesokkakensis TaxID=1519096 RepID=A0A1Y5SMD9_9RHOB|nr:class I SAM-dependent rRNA methyltransferase [Aquimixticola soesokkakensis]SLN44114.1 Ribosomal RNA large subunit methyltransferase I [Aquimixticola soesokkakensis]